LLLQWHLGVTQKKLKLEKVKCMSHEHNKFTLVDPYTIKDKMHLNAVILTGLFLQKRF
jgi:hypothetical protein